MALVHVFLFISQFPGADCKRPERIEVPETTFEVVGSLDNQKLY
jgi:hypothetical protein